MGCKFVVFVLAKSCNCPHSSIGFPDSTPTASAVGRRRNSGATMIIAIDGPAASGKGTLGKKLAAHYGLRHLDTGLLYRAVAKALLDAGHEPGDEARAIAAAKAIDPARFDESALKRYEVGEAASVVSAIPGRARRAVQLPAGVCRGAARRRARRPRHRHRDLPQRRGEDFRHRHARGSRPPPRPGAARPGRERRRDGDPGRHHPPRRARPLAHHRAADAGAGRPSARHQRARYRRRRLRRAGPGGAATGARPEAFFRIML